MYLNTSGTTKVVAFIYYFTVCRNKRMLVFAHWKNQLITLWLSHLPIAGNITILQRYPFGIGINTHCICIHTETTVIVISSA